MKTGLNKKSKPLIDNKILEILKNTLEIEAHEVIEAFELIDQDVIDRITTLLLSIVDEDVEEGIRLFNKI